MGVIGFPNPVDEVSARLVAATVVCLALLTIVFGAAWACPVIAFGFLLRVLAGPKLSPIGLTVTKIVRPRLSVEPKLTAGPPKRFAQGIGAAFSIAGSVLWILDLHTASRVVVAMLAGAASLEAFVGFCLGCAIFSRLMRWGVIPESVCEDCNDISARLSAAR
jgi:hypothetical protein